MISAETDRRWQELMAQAQKGDEISYRTLMTEILPVVRNFVRRRAAFIDTDDVIQDVLTGIHKGRHTYIQGRPFAPWMFAVARYKIVDAIRHHVRHEGREIYVGENIDDVPLEQGAEPVTSELLNNALSQLKPAYRDVIQLTKFDGLSTRQAAEKLGISESALKVRAHRAYDVLRKKLEKAVHEAK